MNKGVGGYQEVINNCSKWKCRVNESWNSREALAASISLALLFYLLLNVFDQASLMLACVSAVLASAFLGMVLARLQGYRELALPLGNRVLMAGVLILILPVAVGSFRQEAEGWRVRSLWVVAILVLMVALVQTRSAPAIAILPVVLLCSSITGSHSLRRIALPLALTGVTALGLYLFADHFEPLRRLKSVLYSGTDTTLSWNNRVRYWSGALQAIRRKPLMGWGSGNVGVRYPPYRIQHPGFTPSGEVVPDLHSVPIQWLFEYSAVGLALRIAAFAIVVGAGFARRTILQQTAVVGLLSFAIFCLVHHNLNNPATILIITMVVIISVPCSDVLALSPLASRSIGLLSVALAMAIFSLQSRLDYANYLLAKGSQQRPRPGVESLIRASILDPRGGFYDAVAAHRIDELLRGEPHRGADARFLFQAADSHYRKALACISILSSY
jgi:O-antigen ligase